MVAKSRQGIAANMRHRERIVELLRGFDLPVRVRGRLRSLAVAFEEDAPLSHIEGLHRFAVVVQHSLKHRSAEAMDSALRAALSDGRDFGVAMLPRPGAPLADSYVLVRLRDFASIAAELEGVER